ncbi:MAG: Fur family transcriptional regulator [Planctomycetota bacterium]|jgi:Fe2+ or Zn2+ uptake regulation protein
MKDANPRDDAARAARSALKGAGLAATRVRVACLALAMRAGAPLARAEFARAMPGRSLDRVTLYRTLRRFEEVGLFRRERTPGGEETWCLGACEHGLRRCPGHMHFECRSCGRVECVKTAPSRVRRALGRLFSTGGVSGEGLPVEGARIEAWGLCRRCTGPGTPVPDVGPARGAGRGPRKRRRA